MPNVFLYLWLQELHSLLTIAASHISDITSVKSQIYSLNFIYLSQDFLSCNPLCLLFIALSNQFLLFLMIQIENNYKFSSLVLVRKENRSKYSYLCNSFVMDQIIKMKCADTTHCQKKKITSQSQIYTEETVRHIFIFPRQSPNFRSIQSVSTVYLLPVTSSTLPLCSFFSSVLCSDFPAGPRVSLFTDSYPNTKTMEIFALTFTLGRKEENFLLVDFYSSQDQTSIFQFLRRKSLYKQILLPFPS